MALTTLKPRLTTLKTSAIPVLDTKAGATQRIRGSAWMRERQEVLRLGKYQCVDCGHISLGNEVDHDTPLEKGGSNDRTNLKVRCTECHKAKTARESSERASRGFYPGVGVG